MLREKECTLHRQRTGSLEDRMIDQGSAKEMIQRIMDQPKGMRSEYTIMQGETVYQPAEINAWAQQFSLSDIPKADDTGGDGDQGNGYFHADPTIKT